MFIALGAVMEPGWAIDPATFPAFDFVRGRPGDIAEALNTWHALSQRGDVAGAEAHGREVFAAYYSDLVARVGAAPSATHLFFGHPNGWRTVEMAVIDGVTHWACLARRCFPPNRPGQPWSTFPTAIVRSPLGEVPARRLAAAGVFDWPSPFGQTSDTGRCFDLICKADGRCRYVQVWPDSLGKDGEQIVCILAPWARRPGWGMALRGWWHRVRNPQADVPPAGGGLSSHSVA